MLPAPQALEVRTLGPCRVPCTFPGTPPYVDEARRVLVSVDSLEVQRLIEAGQPLPAFEIAGPRRTIYFDPSDLVCGIVTCGGLCPGINNVIRSVVLTLIYPFGVRRILGFRYGYAGLSSKFGHEPVALTPDEVGGIHALGGTVLGTSRGPQDLDDMVNTLVTRHVRLLFAIGGDGTLRGATALSRAILDQGLRIGVVGIPKTIDNDIQWTERSFGFATAVEAAQTVIMGAHEEARGAWNGIGLVKLMGRQSGFIAAHATLANSNVNFCLVPEAPFGLKGEGGLLRTLEQRLERKHHAVIVAAEGAGQDLLRRPGAEERDESGNTRLGDIGIFLKEEIARYFGERGTKVAIKYMDPSYAIRSLPANSIDGEFCLALGQHAVHAGMAGRTDMMVGYWNQHFTHVPIALATAHRRELDPQGPVWQRVLEITGQPVLAAAAGA